ncbi:MAG: co-chaperone GroES [Nanoarchaeota archaeon]
MEFIPLKDHILVKPKELEEKTTGGIYIPETAKEKTQEGLVIAVGEGEYMPLKAGDTIIFESYAGTEITLSGKKHLVLKIKDILGKLTK